jgi:hypothetical protein
MQDEPWPPPLSDDRGTTPYPVPGIIRLLNSDHALFRADVDGSELALTRMKLAPPRVACL